MKSNTSRIPRRRSVQPFSSSPLSGRHSYESGRTGLNDVYFMGEDIAKLDSEFQGSDSLGTSRTDWVFEETESPDYSWNCATLPAHPGCLEPPWSGNMMASRLLPASEPFQSALNCENEGTEGTHSRMHNQQQDRDSKRPKLSYPGYPSIGGMRSNSGLNAVSDSSWRYSQVPRSSSILNSSNSELMRERRAHERTDESTSAFVEYGPRNGTATSSTYLQDRVANSHAQGARPKQNVFGSLRLNAPTNHQLPSEHQSSLFTRDSNWISPRQSTPSAVPSSQRRTPSVVTHTASSDGFHASNTETLSSSRQRRSVTEAPTDTEGRSTTRQLLSRLASSMSSTLFSRRSSHESLNTRALDTECFYAGSRVHNSSPPHSSPANLSATSNPNATAVGSSESSQGFRFFRRRRWCLPTGSQSQSSDLDNEQLGESETRSSSSWLSSSFRNRCTPLFSRRRRAGRDETARISSTSETSRLYPFRESRVVDPSEEAAQRPSRAPSAVAPALHPLFRRESREAGPSIESAQRSNGATSNVSAVPEMPNASTAAYIAGTAQSRRNGGLAGLFPNSLFRFDLPPEFVRPSSDSVLITVDVMSSGKTRSSSRDPEKLKKIQESLLLEDSEDEGDTCRICQMGVSASTNLLIEPCKCAGSLQYVHQECMKKWLQAKINAGSKLEAITTCELCKEKLHLDLKDFDVYELYRAHHSERADYEFLSSGLYLVVLLHLCEQRFTNLLGAADEASTRDRFTSLARTLQAHLADLETSEEDSEGDGDC